MLIKLNTTLFLLFSLFFCFTQENKESVQYAASDASNSNNKEIKIAMAQILCIDGDREGNFVRIENAIIDATKLGADLVAFPETSILGWVNPDAHTRAFPLPGSDSDRLCELAKKYNVFINIGLAEKDNDNLFDSAILIDNNGTILLKHRKINILSNLMSPAYTKGDAIKAVDTRLGRIGLMICADTGNNELLLKMSKEEPDLLLVPYGWAAIETAWPTHAKELEKVVKNAAKIVGCPVVGTDLIGCISHGPWEGWVYGGQSIAVDKNSEILAIGKDRDRDIIVFNLKIAD